MLKRTPSALNRKREQNRLAKRAQRQRECDGIRRCSIYFSETVIEALIAQGEDAGLASEQAGRESQNRKKVAANLGDIIEQWARRYLAERARRCRI